MTITYLVQIVNRNKETFSPYQNDLGSVLLVIGGDELAHTTYASKARADTISVIRGKVFNT